MGMRVEFSQNLLMYKFLGRGGGGGGFVRDRYVFGCIYLHILETFFLYPTNPLPPPPPPPTGNEVRGQRSFLFRGRGGMGEGEGMFLDAVFAFFCTFFLYPLPPLGRREGGGCVLRLVFGILRGGLRVWDRGRVVYIHTHVLQTRLVVLC